MTWHQGGLETILWHPGCDGGFHNTGQAREEGKDGELWRSLELPKNLVTQAGPREARKVDER